MSAGTRRKSAKIIELAAESAILSLWEIYQTLIRPKPRRKCPATGIFTWRVRPAQHVRAGAVAGHRNGRRIEDYVRIEIAARGYLAHRLAWLYVYGAWPRGGLDHINRVKSDNRISNLRECSLRENLANSYRQATGRFKGTSRLRGKWGAKVTVNGKCLYLGYFDDRREAALVRATVAYAFYGEFSRPHWRDRQLNL
jgi:hypothetical protein